MHQNTGKSSALCPEQALSFGWDLQPLAACGWGSCMQMSFDLGHTTCIPTYASFSYECLHCRLLIERYGYQTTFLITAALKAVAYFPLILLLTVVDDGIGRFSCGWKHSQQESDEESDEISTRPLLE